MGEPDPSAGEPHEVLGVEGDASPGEIRVAAAKAKRAYNPDAYPPAEKRDAREAFYAVVAAERALLGDTSASPDEDSLPADGVDSSAVSETDEPSPGRGADAETTTDTDTTTRTARTAAAGAETHRVGQPTLSFPESDGRRFAPDGGVVCRVVDTLSGEPRSGYRIYAERVGGDERVDAAGGGTTDAGPDELLPLSPGRWRICAEHAAGSDPPTPTADSTSARAADSAPTVDPVAVTVVGETAEDDAQTSGRRLGGRTRARLSLLAAVVAVAGTAGVVLATYLDGLSTPSALASGVVAAAGVVSYRRAIR